MARPLSAYKPVLGGEVSTLYAQLAVDAEVYDLFNEVVFTEGNPDFMKVVGQCDVTGMVILKTLDRNQDYFVLARHSDLLYYKLIT